MKKSLIPLLLATAALLPAAPCAAEPVGVYVAPRLSAGTVHFRPSANEWTYGGALAVGYDFRPALRVPLRVELEYNKLGDAKKSYTTEDEGDVYQDKITVGASTLFVNAYFDWHNSTAFTPYANLGFGTSSLSVKGKYVDLSDGETGVWRQKTSDHFAWNIGLGSAWRLSETISLDLGYRYANLGNKAQTKDEDVYIKNIGTHQLLLGAKFLF
jgi:opacity protein-like surface antigen